MYAKPVGLTFAVLEERSFDSWTYAVTQAVRLLRFLAPINLKGLSGLFVSPHRLFGGFRMTGKLLAALLANAGLLEGALFTLRLCWIS